MLFDTYAGKMMSLCLRYSSDKHTAQDILQEGFIRLFDNIRQYKFEGSFEGWMRRVFVSVAVRFVSKKKIVFAHIDTTDASDNYTEPTAIARLSENEIHELIKKLPEGYRLVFNLNVIEGYSHEEIAGMLRIETSTSRTQLLKARKMLQGLILKQQNLVSV